jgi:hypothetical protein
MKVSRREEEKTMKKKLEIVHHILLTIHLHEKLQEEKKEKL